MTAMGDHHKWVKGFWYANGRFDGGDMACRGSDGFADHYVKQGAPDDLRSCYEAWKKERLEWAQVEIGRASCRERV